MPLPDPVSRMNIGSYLHPSPTSKCVVQFIVNLCVALLDAA